MSDIVLWRETTSSSACRRVKGCLLGTTLEALTSSDHSKCEKVLLFAHKKEHLMALQKLAYFNSERRVLRVKNCFLGVTEARILGHLQLE